MRPREREDILVSVKERVPETQECHPRSSGSEDFSENIESPRRSALEFIINSILPLRVTNSKTGPFLLNPFTKPSNRRSLRRNSKSKEKLEESRLLKRKLRETTERLLPWVSLRMYQRPPRTERLLSV